MRGATECGQRLRKYFNSLRAWLGKVNRPTITDAATQLILGILSRDVPESKAREALDKLRGMVVDFNELRVIPPIELAEMLDDYPDGRNKGEDIVRALNRVFAQEHSVSLERLRDAPKKEVIAYLEGIDGLEAYTRARIRLLGLEKHAIPLDEAMWALARREKLVDHRCPLAEAQAFLERQIAEEDALEFVALLHKQAWAELGEGVRAGEFEPIQSIPPERKTSHMLQDVAPALKPTVQVQESVAPETHRAGTSARPETTPSAAPSATPRERPKPRSAGKQTRKAEPKPKPGARPAAAQSKPAATTKRAPAAKKKKTKPSSASRARKAPAGRATTRKTTRRPSARKATRKKPRSR